MAEADDLETELKDRFANAAEFVRNQAHQLGPSQLLEFYAHYKQATSGDCSTPRPRWFNVEGKQKWDAWKSLNGLSKDDAMIMYIRLVGEIDSNWENEKSDSWNSVSCMVNGDDHLNDSDKTFIDWVKEGDKAKLKHFPDMDINQLDSDGLAPIHWAADRGNLDMLKFLVDLNADIEMADQDGQTALHYASSCGHINVIKFLLQQGANVKAEDNDGSTPLDVAVDDEILEILNAN